MTDHLLPLLRRLCRRWHCSGERRQRHPRPVPVQRKVQEEALQVERRRGAAPRVGRLAASHLQGFACATCSMRFTFWTV